MCSLWRETYCKDCGLANGNAAFLLFDRGSGTVPAFILKESFDHAEN